MNTFDVLQLPELDAALSRLEDLLVSSAGADDPFLTRVAGHLIAAGGKRLRPSLTVASALAGGATPTDEVLLGGVAVELVHLASLYHDDVMDEATSRRGVQSVNARWGNLIAIVSGDFLLARAAGIAASLGTEVAQLLADTLARLCEGQIVEVQAVFDVERTRHSYLEAIKGKTASLMATACRVGAVVGRLSDSDTDALTIFGENFGMAFQIFDDIADIAGDPSELGKQTGQDLAEGVYTLPTLLALASSHRSAGSLAKLLGKPLDTAERERACSFVADTDGLETALEVGLGYARTAEEVLAGIDNREVARSLANLAWSLAPSLEKGVVSEKGAVR